MRISSAGRRRAALESREQAGYTLIELLVVLAVISIVAAVVTGYTPSRGASRNLKLETYRLEMDLRSARRRAIYEGSPVGFSIDVGNGTWRYADQPIHKVADGISLMVHTGRRLLRGGSTGAIKFYPNGQSSGGKVLLQSLADKNEVNIDWLTGRILQGSDAR